MYQPKQKSFSSVSLFIVFTLIMGCGTETKDASDGGIVMGEADFQITASTSDKIPTVGIVEWSVDITPKDAMIEFGLTESYGMTAPVDLDIPGFRTLLLGMKPSKTYHFRIVAKADGVTYQSSDQTVKTGSVIHSLPPVTQTVYDDTKLTSGFTVSNMGVDSTAFILDQDGDYVWWYQTDLKEATRARMSYDGRYMYVVPNNVNYSDHGGSLLRVDMDGENETIFDLPDLHHDITVLPENTVAYIEYDDGALRSHRRAHL